MRKAQVPYKELYYISGYHLFNKCTSEEKGSYNKHVHTTTHAMHTQTQYSFTSQTFNQNTRVCSASLSFLLIFDKIIKIIILIITLIIRIMMMMIIIIIIIIITIITTTNKINIKQRPYTKIHINVELIRDPHTTLYLLNICHLASSKK